LAKAVAALDADPGLAFVSHWLRTFGDQEWDWTPTDCSFPALLDVNTVNGAALVRRAVWEAAGGQDETLREGCEDWDFWIGLVERGHRGAILPEILFHYRRRADSMSRALVGEKHLELYARLIERHPETFARHLPALWARRQQDLGRCRRDLEALDHEWDEWLAARLDDRRSEAASLPPRPVAAQLLEGRAEGAAARPRSAPPAAQRRARGGARRSGGARRGARADRRRAPALARGGLARARARGRGAARVVELAPHAPAAGRGGGAAR